jgi:hypothetical protein
MRRARNREKVVIIALAGAFFMPTSMEARSPCPSESVKPCLGPGGGTVAVSTPSSGRARWEGPKVPRMGRRTFPQTPHKSPPALSAAAMSAASGSGVIYYVDSIGGSDRFTGRSPSRAWRTLRRASAASLEPGDRLRLRRGRVWTGKLKITVSGTTDKPITISAYGRGPRPRLTSGGCASLLGSHLIARWIRADHCKWSGLYIGGDHVRVERVVSANNVAGIQVGYAANMAKVLRNRLSRNNRLSEGNGSFGVLVNGTNAEIMRNRIRGSGSAVELFGGDNFNGGARIHHNAARGNTVFSEIGKSKGNRYYYNLVISTRTEARGLVTRGGGSRFGPAVGTKFYNNTVYLPGPGSEGFVCGAGCDGSILELRNNIFHTTWKAGYADGPLDEDYDIFFGHQIIQFAKGSHTRITSPRFVNPGRGNLRLRRRSPAIDSGVRQLGSRDFAGVRVPFIVTDRLPGVDRGAFEYR